LISRILAHYRVLDKIGQGGMGEVYRAEDTRLGRQVALKFLPEAFWKDEERRARFGREARVLASLNHPGIAALHSMEKEDGVEFLVLELVEGETLADRIARGPLSLEEAVSLFRQISEALEAAHGKGIVHRDLKPSNVKIAPGGKVKVLDFGLAKTSMPAPGSGDLSQSPTVSRQMTESGIILGTAAYMSPEQARGDAVDKRTDIWAFGCCLHEALTGKAPFAGRTVSDTLAKILETEPEWDRVPAGLRPLLKRCLRKDPDRRIHDIADVRIELEESAVSEPETVVARRRWLPVVLAALGASAVTAVLFTLMRTETPGTQRALQLTSAVGVESYPTWSPDGGRLAYESNQTGDWDVWVTQLGGGEPVNLTADAAGADRFPSWSPDGQQIAYLSERDRVWALYTLSALGGRPRKLLSLPPADESPPWGSPQWSTDGTELAVAIRNAGRNFVEIVSVDSRQSRQIPLPEHDEDAPHDLSWSPDGRYFAYVAAILSVAEVTRLWILPSSGGEALPVTDGYTNVWDPSWSPDGRELSFVSNLGGSMDLWEQTIGDGGVPQGPPERITTGVEVRTAAFSPDGTRLAYSRGRRYYDSNIWRVRILHDRLATWADAEQLTFDNAFIQWFDVSRDGKRLVFSSDRAGNQDLWVMPAGGGEMTQLTTHLTPDWNPRWSPDGAEVAFFGYRTGNREIWVMPSDGEPARQLTFHAALDIHPTWSPDGQDIAFTSKRTGNWDIWLVPAKGGEPQQVTTDSADEGTPEWSPDGQWLGFTQFSSRRFLGLPASLRGEPRILARGPAQGCRWSRDGKFIFYAGDREKAGNLWAASLESGKEYRLTDFFGRRGRLSFNLATDGEYLYFHWDEDVADLWVMDVNP